MYIDGHGSRCREVPVNQTDRKCSYVVYWVYVLEFEATNCSISRAGFFVHGNTIWKHTMPPMFRDHSLMRLDTTHQKMDVRMLSHLPNDIHLVKSMMTHVLWESEKGNIRTSYSEPLGTWNIQRKNKQNSVFSKILVCALCNYKIRRRMRTFDRATYLL